MKTLLLIDTETGGLDPAVYPLVEVGCVLWSVTERCAISSWSELIAGNRNQASAINGIPWRPDVKAWMRSMPPEDTAALGFRVREVGT